jgi:hypothetical protein
MKNFVIYDPPTGTILRCGFCTDDDFELQANEGEGIIEHERVDDTLFHVIDGQVVEIG